MTLVWQLLIGLSAILLISGLEGTSIGCTMQWVAAGAPGSAPSCGSSGTSKPPGTGQQ